jgi:hypothetical protein
MLLHSLRMSCPLHAIDVAAPTLSGSISYVTMSSQGHVLSHAWHDVTKPQPSTYPPSSDAMSTLPGPSASSLSASSSTWRDTTIQSELVLVSMNGHVLSQTRITAGTSLSDAQHRCHLHEDSRDVHGKSMRQRPEALVLRAVVFTNCGAFVVTANAGREGGLEVRPIGDLNTVLRRIETSRTSILTCFGLSQDERYRYSYRYLDLFISLSRSMHTNMSLFFPWLEGGSSHWTANALSWARPGRVIRISFQSCEANVSGNTPRTYDPALVRVDVCTSIDRSWSKETCVRVSTWSVFYHVIRLEEIDAACTIMRMMRFVCYARIHATTSSFFPTRGRRWPS